MVLRIRLSHKIAAIGATGVLGLALVGGIYLSGNAAQDVHRQSASEARGVSAVMNRVSVSLLDARRAEKDFLLRSAESYAKRHAALAKGIGADLEKLRQQASGQSELAAKVETI